LTQAETNELDRYDIRKHNKVRLSHLTQQELLQISDLTVDLLLEIPVNSVRDHVSNRGFVDGLQQLTDDLRDADNQSERRTRIVGEVSVGVSMSLTVGALAWAFRGGALLSSLMATIPVWSVVDYTHLISKSEKNKRDDAEAGQAEVERIFD